MKGFFRRLTLPAKLILIGTLPLIFLLVIAYQYQKEKLDKLEVLDGYRERLENAIEFNNLLYQIQSERRYSFGYVLKGSWQSEMLLQRTKTDEQIKKVLEATQNSLPELPSYTFLNQLSDFRIHIDKKEVQPLDVMNYYTNAIFRLNTLNGVVTGNNKYLLPVIKTVTGQKILSDLITYRGMVLAQLYLMLETKQSNPQLINSIIQLQNIITTYSREFAIKAPQQYQAALEALKNDLDVKETTAIEMSLRNKRMLDTSISSEFYWNVATKALDKVKAVQQTMIIEGKAGTNAIYQRERQNYIWTLVALVTILLVVIAIILLSIKVITETLGEIREAAKQIAAGQTGIHLQPETNDAIGALSQSILDIDRNAQKLSVAARAIGEGDFSVPVLPRSREDVLGNAIVQMKQNLQDFRRNNEEKLWVQTGNSLVNERIRGDKGLADIAEQALQFVVEYLECETGLLYLAHEQSLQLQSGYAIGNMEKVPQILQFGETLVGQVAKNKSSLLLKEVPDQFLTIRSGLGETKPRSLLVFPLLVDEAVEGVIEVATLGEIPAYKVAFANEIASDIAIALRAAKSKQQLQVLFEQTQAQAEELQSQHAELENINSELEAQAEKLKASEEELKVQQEELLQANQELEERSRMLEERNHLILEKNLEIQKKAEELTISTRYKSEFLANMSHELRTPLNSVLLLSRLLAENNDKNLKPEQVEYAQVIQSSGQGLLSLIDEILDLSKIEAGKMELEFHPVMIQEIAQDMQALFTPIAKDKGIGFSIDVESKVPSQIVTDKMRVEQVLKNLLSNALKFTSKGTVSLTINRLPENHSFIAFTVKDTGIGIPREKQALIFEAFQQADGSTRRKFGGTGLGLSISRELTRLLGGEIKVSSEAGVGSEFTIYIPSHPSIAENKPAPAAPKAVPAHTPPATPAPSNLRAVRIPENLPDDRNSIKPGDKSILIIEDDTAFAKALLDFARKKGYKGLVSVRGDDGIALAQQFVPKGILLDLQLPVKDGWEVMEALKSNPVTRPIPVHIMSSMEAKKESLVKGAVDFINKPVAFEQMQEVFSKIEQVLTREHKKVLIVEENPKHAKALAYFLETFNVSTEISNSINKGIDALQKEEINCVILDMGIPDPNAYQTLEAVKKSAGMEHLPVIIFTGKNLSKSEELRIKQYADTIVVKTAHSYQRILDEVSLFLHLVEDGNNGKPTARYTRLGALNEVLADKKILVVDDDVRNIFSLTKALEMHNMRVVTAVDGKEALKQLGEHPDTQIVLMDIMMPEMDGYEAMRHIRQQAGFKQLPIIAITAKAMTGDREKCIQAGASDYISKPVDIDQLLSLLRVWLYDKSM